MIATKTVGRETGLPSCEWIVVETSSVQMSTLFAGRSDYSSAMVVRLNMHRQPFSSQIIYRLHSRRGKRIYAGFTVVASTLKNVDRRPRAVIRRPSQRTETKAD